MKLFFLLMFAFVANESFKNPYASTQSPETNITKIFSVYRQQNWMSSEPTTHNSEDKNLVQLFDYYRRQNCRNDPCDDELYSVKKRRVKRLVKDNAKDMITKLFKSG